eukprot:scaffold3059_cov131-Amphora_coffeaeformis.AAC.5
MSCCHICWEDAVPTHSTTVCSHAYCQPCWTQWITSCETKQLDPTCPECRLSLPSAFIQTRLGRPFLRQSWRPRVSYASATNHPPSLYTQQQQQQQQQQREAPPASSSSEPMDLEDALTLAALREQLGAKQCPNCHIWIERVAGCNAMMCLCGQRFCFDCGWMPTTPTATTATTATTTTSTTSNGTANTDSNYNNNTTTHCGCGRSVYYDNVARQEVADEEHCDDWDEEDDYTDDDEETSSYSDTENDGDNEEENEVDEEMPFVLPVPPPLQLHHHHHHQQQQQPSTLFDDDVDSFIMFCDWSYLDDDDNDDDMDPLLTLV